MALGEGISDGSMGPDSPIGLCAIGPPPPEATSATELALLRGGAGTFRIRENPPSCSLLIAAAAAAARNCCACWKAESWDADETE